MAISFNNLPATRVPGAYVEIDASRASSNLDQQTRILVLGQRLSSGTVAANVPTLITSKDQAIQSFGVGSLLASQFETLFLNNDFTEKWALALDDNPAGVAASGTLTVTASSALTGTLNVYLGGEPVQALVASGDSATTIATALAAAINKKAFLPVTAVAAGAVVTVTFRHKGLVGNQFKMALNWGGKLSSEVLPAGVNVAIVQLSGGTADPDLSAALSVLPDEIFNFILSPYNSLVALQALDTELSSRWAPLRMLEGHAFVAASGTVGELVTLGESLNCPYISLLDAGSNSPTPAYLWSAALIGQVARAATIDPARPFNGLPLVNVLAKAADLRTLSERDTLLHSGVATHKVSLSGKVMIERLTTTYRLNSFDLEDGAFLDANTLFTLSYFRQGVRRMVTTLFPRHKLADDGTNFGAGQAVVTPKIMKSHLLAVAMVWEEMGLLEDLDTFKKTIIVERNLADRSRLDVMLPPNLVNQLHVFAAQIQFII